MKRNWYNNELVVQNMQLPAVRNADLNTGSLDTLGYDSAVIMFHVGLSADTINTTNKIELEIEESDDNSAWNDAPNASLVNPDTGAAGFVAATNVGTTVVIDSAAKDELIYAVRYAGSKRYVRAVLNFSGTHTTGTPIGVLGALAGKQVI